MNFIFGPIPFSSCCIHLHLNNFLNDANYFTGLPQYFNIFLIKSNNNWLFKCVFLKLF